MRFSPDRFADPLTAWIPDLSRLPLRRQIVIGIIASIFFHALGWALISFVRIEPPPPAKPQIKPKLRGIELTIQPPEPEPEPVTPFQLAAAPEPPLIDSRGLDIATEAALNPLFQSDENMRAASELPATGSAPLPSQDGLDRPFNAFKSQRSLLGTSRPQPFPSAPETPLTAVPPPRAPPAPKIAQQEPPPPPPEPPAPTEKVETGPVTEPKKFEPLKAVDRPREDEIALTAKSTAPPATPPPIERPVATPPPVAAIATPRPAEPQQQAMLTTPAPRPQTARESGYQPEQEKNRIEGSITNRGRNAVDARATPLAKYQKQVNDAIGSRWYFYVKDPKRQTLIAPGSARISFSIDLEGKISRVRVESNSSNASFEELCTSAVRDAREQIKELRLPTDATIPLKDGRLECSLTFTFYNL